RVRILNWSLKHSHSTLDCDSGCVNSSYKVTYAILIAGYIQSPDSKVVCLVISGGFMALENVITLSKPITVSAILIKAPG
ncbi:fimbria/pilus outer membrane usher protein, partial [Salmonella enterica]